MAVKNDRLGAGEDVCFLHRQTCKIVINYVINLVINIKFIIYVLSHKHSVHNLPHKRKFRGYFEIF